ncbi:MAG: GNAT family N-acetyltransferase [Desulfobacterales bacterium]|nr:GNAT family N-acetyltransferase [Desulfobacterales bacterium]
MTDMLVKLYGLPDPSSGTPENTIIRRALAAERPAVARWVRWHFGAGWAAECETAFMRMPVSGFIALQDNQLAGFCVYDCTARGMLGPIGIAAPHQRRGIGRALLLAALHDMRANGYAYAVVGWVEEQAFFRQVAGATPIPDSDPGIYRGMLIEDRHRS